MEPNNYCFSPRCQKPHDDQVLSPPLTPALSPYNRDLNYRRASSDDYRQPYWSPQQQQQQQQQPQRAMSFSDQPSSTRKRPIKQNKHACTYPRCFWSFKRFEHLKRHMLVHTGERPHGCPFPGCGKRFSRTDNFHAHYRTHAKKNLQKNNDDFGAPPSSPPSMNHSNSDIDPQRHPSISFSSSRRSILTNDQPPIHHQYPYAHSPYHREQQQMHHLKHQQAPHPPPPQSLHPQQQQQQQRPSSYDSDKQHVCTHHQCQRRFKRLEHLKRHMRIHTMERPFHCNFPGCQKAFSRSDNLTQHSKTHLRSNESRGSRNNSTSSSSSSPLSSSSSTSLASPSSFYSHHPPPPPVLHPDSLGFNDYMRPSSNSPSSSYNKHRQDPPPSSLHPMLHWQQHTGDATSGSINC